LHHAARPWLFLLIFFFVHLHAMHILDN
jgi:hypothetical protein